MLNCVYKLLFKNCCNSVFRTVAQEMDVAIEKGEGTLPSSRDISSSFNIISVGSICNCVLSSVTLAFFGILVFLCKDYIKLVLLWIESQDSWVVCLIFVGLFTFVSFPFTWGYIFLNIACGYLFGIVHGFIVVAVTASLGVFIAHTIIRIFLADFVVLRFFNNENARAILMVISGPQAFKVVAFARLTPIPFGLQNTIFAVSTTLLTCVYLF